MCTSCCVCSSPSLILGGKTARLHTQKLLVIAWYDCLTGALIQNTLVEPFNSYVGFYRGLTARQPPKLTRVGFIRAGDVTGPMTLIENGPNKFFLQNFVRFLLPPKPICFLF